MSPILVLALVLAASPSLTPEPELPAPPLVAVPAGSENPGTGWQVAGALGAGSVASFVGAIAAYGALEPVTVRAGGIGRGWLEAGTFAGAMVAGVATGYLGYNWLGALARDGSSLAKVAIVLLDVLVLPSLGAMLITLGFSSSTWTGAGA